MAGGDPAGRVQRVEFSTQDEAETEEFIRQIYVGNRSWFHGARDGASFSATVAGAEDITASRLRSTVDYSAVCDPLDHYVFWSVSHGRLRVKSGRQDDTFAAGDQSFYPVGAGMEVDLFDMGVSVLQVPVARLAVTAEATAGINAADLRFGPARPVSPAMARQWAAFLELATGMLLDEDPAGVSPLLAEQLTQTAAITALHTFPNTALTVSYQPGPGWVAPSAVRRAAGFIHAHAAEPINLADIAAAAGASGRALQHGFRRHLAVTPTGYLRRVRLEHADAELRAAGPASGLTVAAVARRWGWASPSRFAAAYRQRFGVPPSRALRR